jgi:tRNA G18 (ribose-2'-O)-methylase SpoU
VLIQVAGVDDPRLDDYRNVPDAEMLRARGLFIAEGRHVVRRLLASRFRTCSVLLTPAACASLGDVVDHAHDLPVYVASQDTMNGIAGFDIHRGCLAVGERPAARAWEEITVGAPLVVVLERVSNADNVGAIFRNAAAFGAGAVLLGPGCADPLYRKAIRTSMGAALGVPFAWMPDWPADLIRLGASGFTLLALTPTHDARPLRGSDTTGPVALIVGHEGDGLSAEALAAANVRVQIPMTAGVDSLNVATAAAIALHELSRR